MSHFTYYYYYYECHYAQCHYGERRYTECYGAISMTSIKAQTHFFGIKVLLMTKAMQRLTTILHLVDKYQSIQKAKWNGTLKIKTG